MSARFLTLVVRFNDRGPSLENWRCKTPDNQHEVNEVLMAVGAIFRDFRAGDRLRIDLEYSDAKSGVTDVLTAFERFRREKWEEMLGNPACEIDYSPQADDGVSRLSISYYPSAALPGESLALIPREAAATQPPHPPTHSGSLVIFASPAWPGAPTISLAIRDDSTNIDVYIIFNTSGWFAAVSTEDAECYMSDGPHKLNISELFRDLPDDPKARLGAVVALQREFRRKAAEVLQPAVDALLRSPPESFADKQALASELNSSMHDLGLGLTHGGDDSPCSIVANRSQSVQSGWLRLRHRNPSQEGVPSFSAPTTKIDDIKVVEAVREERLSQRGRGRG